MVRAMFGLPILTRSGDAALQSDAPGAPGPSNSQGIDPQLALPPMPAPRVQGTITLTAEQWTATQATLQRLETRLNDQQRSQSQHRSHSCESCRDNNRPNALKPRHLTHTTAAATKSCTNSYANAQSTFGL